MNKQNINCILNIYSIFRFSYNLGCIVNNTKSLQNIINETIVTELLKYSILKN